MPRTMRKGKRNNMDILSELIKAMIDVGMVLVVVVGLGVLLFIVGMLLSSILDWFKERREK